MATKFNNSNNSTGMNINKVYDTKGVEVKTQKIEGDLYLVGKQKGSAVYLQEADGKGMNGIYEGVGNLLVERSESVNSEQLTVNNGAVRGKVNVAGMSADDKLAALSAKGKANGFVKMSNADGEGSIWKMVGGVPQHVDDKEIEQLLGIILDQDYIHNMRTDRSWVLPQMVWMLFDPKTGRMDTKRYRELVIGRGFNDAWDLLVHNLGVMAHIEKKDPDAFRIWEYSWNKDLAIDMARNDLANAKAYVKSLPTHHCSKFYPRQLEYVKITAMHGKGHTGNMYFTERAEDVITRYISADFSYKKKALKTRAEQQFLSDMWAEFEQRIDRIRSARTTKQLRDAVKAYADARIQYPADVKVTKTNRYWDGRKYVTNQWRETVFVAKFPEQYISAFKADGAYYTMRTILRYYGKKLGGVFARKSTRDAWLQIIDTNMKDCAYGEGYKMFGLMVNEFLPKAGLITERDFKNLKNIK